MQPPSLEGYHATAPVLSAKIKIITVTLGTMSYTPSTARNVETKP